ncbi:MAG: SGNH/GDSL hydrolase family protein [Sinomonas sp.]|nr:SGNH/GDSL hydrolase family protein [Sinomonas sp.]
MARFAKPKTVAFIGDSYTAGAAGVPESRLWPELLSEARGWQYANLALGGTGYVTGSDSSAASLDGAGCGTAACDDYLGMVPSAVAAAPDVVIVSGGRNDVGKPTPEIQQNVRAVFAELRKGLPNAKIVALSPILGADDSPSSFPEMKPAVKTAVESVGGVYVDLGAPFAGHPELIWTDGVHPTADGQQVLADTVNRLMPRFE